MEKRKRHTEGHHAPFPILADEAGTFYQRYRVERSVAGTLKGMIFRAPTLLRAMGKGYLPTSLEGSLTTMPADFLIDEQGVIEVAHYGTDDGDHLPLEAVRAFSQGSGEREAVTRDRRPTGARG